MRTACLSSFLRHKAACTRSGELRADHLVVAPDYITDLDPAERRGFQQKRSRHDAGLRQSKLYSTGRKVMDKAGYHRVLVHRDGALLINAPAWIGSALFHCDFATLMAACDGASGGSKNDLRRPINLQETAEIHRLILCGSAPNIGGYTRSLDGVEHNGMPEVQRA